MNGARRAVLVLLVLLTMIEAVIIGGIISWLTSGDFYFWSFWMLGVCMITTMWVVLPTEKEIQ